MTNRMPALFVGHGSPMNAIEDNVYSRAWSALGKTIVKPKAILSVSAHWFTRGTKINNQIDPATIYDMYGFPDELYRVTYPAPGSPEIAKQVQDLLGESVSVDNHWGIDHGAWSVLGRVFPEANIPVVSLSVNAQLTPEAHFAIGRALKPLRDEGILLFGSGNIVHNLSRVDWRRTDGNPWAEEFDQYIHRAILEHRLEDVLHYSSIGDSAELSVPSADHFAPLLYVLGASDETDQISVFNADCMLGSMSMTSYLFDSKKWDPEL